MASVIDIKLTLAAQEAAKQLKGIKSDLDAVEKAEGEVESAGKQMASALSSAADTIKADLDKSTVSADKLGQALGPDLAAKLGRSGVEDLVTDLKRLGLTTDEIDADVDALAASIQHLDQVGSSLNGPQKGLRDVGDSADYAKGKVGGMRAESDNSRSVLANMAGNTTQDLGAIGGAAGNAGLALGQMAEYATEGNISMGGLAKVAGPLAALTVVTMAISQGAKQAAARAKELQTAFKDLSSATDTQVLETYSLMMVTAALDGKTLEDQMKQLADDNIVGARRLLDLSEAQGMSIDQTRLLREAIAEHDAGVVRAAENDKKYGDQLDETATAADGLTVAELAAKGGTVALDAALVGGNVAAKAMRGSIDKLGTAMGETRQDAIDLGTEIDVLAGNLDVEQEAIAFDEQITTAMENAKTKIGLTRSEIIDLEQAVIKAGETTGKTPFQIKSTVAMVEAGDLESVRMAVALWYVQNPISIASRLALPTMTRDGKPKASGGPVSGLFTMNEMGRETFYAPPGSHVLAANQTAQHEAQAAYVDNSTVINHWPPGINPSAVAHAQRDYFRRGGR